MNTVAVLVEGYAKMTDTGWNASSSACLIITDSGLKIITDPGANRDLLLKKLEEIAVDPEEINYVFITHHHLDHAMNIALFPNAQVIDEEALYTQAVAIEGVEAIPNTTIRVMKTPGHEYAHASLIVPTTEGTVIIAGDVFWWEESDEQKIDLNKKDDFAEKMEVLIDSRRKILEIADIIIPGHGKKMRIK